MVTVATLVNNVVSSVKNAKELAKQSGDTDLKAAIAEVYNDILDLKDRVGDLNDENRLLRQKLTEKAEITRHESGYFFKKGETAPLCPHCYQAPPNYAVVYLEVWNQSECRCRVCDKMFYRHLPYPINV